MWIENNYRRMVLSFMAREFWSKTSLHFMSEGLNKYYSIWKIAIDYQWECGFRVRHPRLG